MDGDENLTVYLAKIFISLSAVLWFPKTHNI